MAKQLHGKIDKLIQQAKSSNRELVRRDILQGVNSLSSNLALKILTYCYSDGISKDLLCLCGTVSCHYRGNRYNIPIEIWLQQDHPNVSPLVYVKPTSDMYVSETSKNVQPDGTVIILYLKKWRHPDSNINGLLNEISEAFSQSPPVYTKGTSINSSIPYPTNTSFTNSKASTSNASLLSTHSLTSNVVLNNVDEQSHTHRFSDIAGEPQRMLLPIQDFDKIMAQSKTEKNVVDEAEHHIQWLRQHVIQSWQDHGKMPIFNNYRQKVALEHNAKYKAVEPSIIKRTQGLLKRQYADKIAGAVSFFTPENFENFYRDVNEFGMMYALRTFFRNFGFNFITTELYSFISTIIIEYWEQNRHKYPTFSPENISTNVSNAAAGCILSVLYSVIVNACMYLFHHWRKVSLQKQVVNESDHKVKTEMFEKIRHHQMSKEYITSWRNIIKNLFNIILGGIAALSLAGTGLIIAAVLIPWIIWVFEKLYDHFTGKKEIGFITKAADFIFGKERYERIHEYWNDEGQESSVPHIFKCPITHTMMVDPVMNNCGQIYERNELLAWLKTSNRDPMTNGAVALDSIISLPELKDYIFQFAKQHSIDLIRERTTIAL
ncbi:hypothetical protein I4U23_027238 [Adineta vaga]|nr:hypothetical protein I4U23_027238 [Adineta vaga]